MHHLLAGSRIKLTYLQDWRALVAINWRVVYGDLADAGTPFAQWQWCDLDGLTHVVLATDRVTGRYCGVLGLTGREAEVKPWLLIEAALVRPSESGGTLLRAMLAHVLARIVCLDGKPAAIAASRANDIVLRDLSVNIRLAAMHPPAAGNVIAFRAATLARQIGVGGTVLDLRSVPEASLLRDLRELHDVRREKRPSFAGLPAAPGRAMAKPAMSAAAMRRPRTTTRTGRNG